MNLTIIAFILSFIVLPGCRSKAPKDQGPHSQSEIGKIKESRRESIESKQLASLEQTDLVKEVVFKTGSSNLSKSDKNEIKALFNKAKTRSEKIDKVKIITWADKEYPSKKQKELNKKQQDLVTKRNDSVEKYIKELDKKVEVAKVSMAKPTGKIERAFSSTESQTQEMVEETEIPDTASKNKFAGKASRSIIMLIPKKKD